MSINFIASVYELFDNPSYATWTERKILDLTDAYYTDAWFHDKLGEKTLRTRAKYISFLAFEIRNKLRKNMLFLLTEEKAQQFFF